eukprot:CAMPEP_0170062606 /NCGR_PEP_ID=MMETSP0019_2-20121128/3770_1 /TAXON_ID=98059 /ORGANISM="Dinobryon sp., Strain UTEXLB2267" /LENGTH=124 /DNA_ID=CAMNT_0010268797 /DNA_START=39 /DNA_END=413 /DNA_ORIENTATION=+
MRISKKFAGRCVGKKSYKRDIKKKNADMYELSKLEELYLQSISTANSVSGDEISESTNDFSCDSSHSTNPNTNYLDTFQDYSIIFASDAFNCYQIGESFSLSLDSDVQSLLEDDIISISTPFPL